MEKKICILFVVFIFAAPQLLCAKEISPVLNQKDGISSAKMKTVQQQENSYQETKDEYKYFRVLSGGRKYFYASPEDYFMHNKNKISPMYINEDKLFIYTNVDGKIIFIE